jgi:hypothetical protein
VKLDDDISNLVGNPLGTDETSREREYRPEIVLDRVAWAYSKRIMPSEGRIVVVNRRLNSHPIASEKAMLRQCKSNRTLKTAI